jgi:DNA-binding NarL/FixJ family response regulator
MDNLKLLIADDHHLIRRGVRDLLAARPDWHVVAEAKTGSEAVRLAAELTPDIAILDYSMPTLRGPDVAKQLATHSPSTRALLLTMHDLEPIVLEVLESGAWGLVLKNDADQFLIEAIEAVALGRHFFTPKVSRHFAKGFVNKGRAATSKPVEIRLTEREQEILKLLAHGMANKEIAFKLNISVRTVESHRININRKYNFKSFADLIRYALRSNIISTAPERAAEQSCCSCSMNSCSISEISMES